MSACLRVFLSGYCGADIKALCTEAALMALRRRYPQIYGSSVKLKLDVTSIVLGPGDFSKAMRAIVPASQRALVPPGRALSPTLRPLLATTFSLVLKALLRVFPHAQCTDRDNTQGKDPLKNQLDRLFSCTHLLLLSNWIFFFSSSCHPSYSLLHFPVGILLYLIIFVFATLSLRCFVLPSHTDHAVCVHPTSISMLQHGDR